MVGDHGKCGHLGAGSRSRRNGNQRDNFSRHFVCAFVFRDASAVFCRHTDCLCYVHRRAAAECYEKVCAGSKIAFGCFFYCRHRRVRLNICENIGCNAGCFQTFCCFFHNAHFFRVGPERIIAWVPPIFFAHSGSLASVPAPTIIFCGIENFEWIHLIFPLFFQKACRKFSFRHALFYPISASASHFLQGHGRLLHR